MRSVLFVLFVLILSTSAWSGEPTAEDRQRARDLYDSASRHFRGGDLDKAAAEFKESYDLSGNVELLWNLAQTHRLAKHPEQALFFYKQYRAARPDLLPASRAPLDARISELEALVKQQQQTQTAPPDGPEHPAEVVTPPRTAPEPVGVVVSAAPTPANRSGSTGRAVGFSVGAAGLAIGAVGGILLGVASAEGNHADKATSQADFNLHHRNDLTYQSAGWPLLGIGIGALASGAIIVAISARHRR